MKSRAVERLWTAITTLIFVLRVARVYVVVGVFCVGLKIHPDGLSYELESLRLLRFQGTIRSSTGDLVRKVNLAINLYMDPANF